MVGADISQWADIASVSDAVADRRIITGNAGDLKHITIKAGTSVGRHEHAFEQFFMVLEGGGVLLTESGESALRAGTVVHFAPHVWHSARFDSDTVLVEVNFAVKT